MGAPEPRAALSDVAAGIYSMIRNAPCRAFDARKGNPELQKASGLLWRANAASALSDEEVQFLAEAIEAKVPKSVARGAIGVVPYRFPKRHTPARPDRRNALRLKRRLAASGPMPPALAANFTTGELAALKVVADECRTKGSCRLYIDEIARRAGVRRTTVQNALRHAGPKRTTAKGEVGHGLLLVTLRPVDGQKNNTNIIEIVSPGWNAWITHRKPKPEGIGFKMPNREVFQGEERRTSAPKPAAERQQHLLLPIPGGKAVGLGNIERLAAPSPLSLRSQRGVG